MFSLSYPARNAHAPYCHLWPAPPYNTFPHSLINGTNFERKKKVTEHKTCILISSTTFLWHVSHSKKKWARCDQKCLMVFMSSTRYYFPILSKLEFSWQFFRKILKYQISWKSDQCETICSMGTDGRTNIYEEANIRFHNFQTPLKVHFWRCYGPFIFLKVERNDQ